MNSDIKKILDEYIEAFLNQDIVKKYFLLESEINNSEYLNNLQEDMRKAQKALALSLNDGTYQAKKDILLKLQDEFYNDPRIVNYHLLQEEIYLKLNELKSKIK